MVVEYKTATQEVIDFLASTPSPDQILAFKASPATQARVRYLLDANRTGTLTEQERTELDEFEHLDHIVSMLKIRVRERLAE